MIAEAPPPKRFVARWDLDKTYLRTEFDTLRDLVRTAFERPDQKRTVPGAGSVLRELAAAGAEVHILSGSPRQMRSRIEQKLRLDGATYASLTLKPNLENVLRLRLRAVRDQLGYKLPALLSSRASLVDPRGPDGLVREVLLGDDAEADAFVYSLYGDICSGQVDDRTLEEILRKGGAYEDSIAEALQSARVIEKGVIVDRILIHLDRQTPPGRFASYGRRVVPFYNYLQAAFVLAEDGHLPARGVVRVAAELVIDHRFDADALARSYVDLRKRGRIRGDLVPAIRAALAEVDQGTGLPAVAEVRSMCDRIEESLPPPPRDVAPEPPMPDYLALVGEHNRRRK